MTDISTGYSVMKDDFSTDFSDLTKHFRYKLNALPKLSCQEIKTNKLVSIDHEDSKYIYGL